MKNHKKRNLLLSLILAAVCIAFLLYVDKFQHYSMLASVLKKGAIYSLVAVSLNLLNGFTGLFSLGQAGFMMIGAYTYAILTIPVASRASVYQYFDGGVVQFCLPMIVGLLLAGVVPALFAYLIGLPVLKLKSDYLAIATLGFAEIMRAIIQWKVAGPLTNGSNLLKKFANFDSVLFPFIVSGICIAVIVLIINSTYGRAFKAIRDDEIAAEAMGINLAKHKMQAFLISSFFAGLGGALLAMFQFSVQANAFTSTMTYEILLIVVIGGIGSVTGSIIGSLHFGFVPVYRLLRVVAAFSGRPHALPGREHPVHARRLPYAGVLRGHHDRGAVLPQGHHGRQGVLLGRHHQFLRKALPEKG